MVVWWKYFSSCGGYNFRVNHLSFLGNCDGFVMFHLASLKTTLPRSPAFEIIIRFERTRKGSSHFVTDPPCCWSIDSSYRHEAAFGSVIVLPSLDAPSVFLIPGPSVCSTLQKRLLLQDTPFKFNKNGQEL